VTVMRALPGARQTVGAKTTARCSDVAHLEGSGRSPSWHRRSRLRCFRGADDPVCDAFVAQTIASAVAFVVQTIASAVAFVAQTIASAVAFVAQTIPSAVRRGAPDLWTTTAAGRIACATNGQDGDGRREGSRRRNRHVESAEPPFRTARGGASPAAHKNISTFLNHAPGNAYDVPGREVVPDVRGSGLNYRGAAFAVCSLRRRGRNRCARLSAAVLGFRMPGRAR
jgi:hypothetical protein